MRGSVVWGQACGWEHVDCRDHTIAARMTPSAAPHARTERHEKMCVMPGTKQMPRIFRRWRAVPARPLAALRPAIITATLTGRVEIARHPAPGEETQRQACGNSPSGGYRAVEFQHLAEQFTANEQHCRKEKNHGIKQRRERCESLAAERSTGALDFPDRHEAQNGCPEGRGTTQQRGEQQEPNQPFRGRRRIGSRRVKQLKIEDDKKPRSPEHSQQRQAAHAWWPERDASRIIGERRGSQLGRHRPTLLAERRY